MPPELRIVACTTVVFALIGLAACESREVVQSALEPPSGALSGIIGFQHDTSFEVVAFDVEAPPELPSVEDIDQVDPLRFFTRFYDQPLSGLGIQPGPVPARTNEEEFGTIPRSAAYPEDRLLTVRDGVVPEDWTLGAAGPPFSTFVSPRLAVDPQACSDLETMATMVPGPGGTPTRVAAISSDRALVTFGAGKAEQIYDVHQDGGRWSSTLLEEDHPLSRLVRQRGSISFLQGDGEGGVLVGDCVGPPGTKTSTVWHGATFEAELEPMFFEDDAPDCPAELLRVDTDEWALRRHNRSLVWLRRGPDGVTGTPVVADATARPAELRLQGRDVLGMGSPDRVHLFRDGSFIRSESPPLEEGERLYAITPVGEELAAVAPQVTAGLGNSFYLRSPAGQWRAWQRVNAQLASRMATLNATVIFSVTFGTVLQLSPRDGLCPEQTTAITGIYVVHHLLALDAGTFVVAGTASSADPSAPSRVSILRARPKVL